jgi:hypothetical protein
LSTLGKTPDDSEALRDAFTHYRTELAAG